jgi:hypothetical protein
LGVPLITVPDNVNVVNGHPAMINEQNDHVAKLNAKIAKHELENKKIKFALVCITMGDNLALRIGLVPTLEPKQHQT